MPGEGMFATGTMFLLKDVCCRDGGFVNAVADTVTFSVSDLMCL